MHVRMSTSEGATDIDAIVAHIRDRALPQLKGQKGFRGMTASADRAAALMSVLTLWDTEEDLKASDAQASDIREKAMEATGGRVQQVQVFEQLVWETGATPPAPGCRLLVTPIKLDPAKIDENIAFFRAMVLPEITTTPGFRAVRNMVNRKTGEGMVGTVWEDDASLEQSLAQFAERRPLGEARGVEFGEPFRREVIFTGTA
jgi:heme-degrading monooxygenase HmoA